MRPTLVERFGRFVVVGVANTAVHALVALAMIGLTGASQTLANVAAFCVAALFSYLANARWTFGASLRPISLARFLGVALLGLAATAIVASLVEALGGHPVLGVAAVVLTVTPLSFAAHQLWTFRSRRAPSVQGEPEPEGR